jgi:hypothetical protein
MVGNTTDLYHTNGVASGDAANLPASTLYVPLQFWFCRNPGLALPLIALQYHEVKFNISFQSLSNCLFQYAGTGATTEPFSGTAPSLGYASLYIDYVYLDTDERRQFAQVQHEYLIEQLQFTGGESITAQNYKAKLALNHPCKELVWVLQPTNNLFGDYTNSGSDLLESAKLQLNGQDRFSQREAAYFNLVQPYQHHTRIPGTGVYVYSFSLNPEQHQPSGSVNMSRIDNATLLLNLTGAVACELSVFAVNYNVLRIMAGMGGLAYSN